MSTSPTGRRFWRRLPIRLSVRTLMVLVLLVGGAVGWIVQRGRAQREVVDAIERAGGHVSYGFTWLPRDPVNGDGVPDWAARFVDTIGPDYVCDVLRVRLRDLAERDDDLDELMVQVARLHQLRQLSLDGSSLTDAGLAHLRGLTNLEDLWLCRTRAPGAGLRYLSGMTRLRRLRLPGAALRDGDLVYLEGLSKLESLLVRDESILPENAEFALLSDAGLVHLRGLTNLTSLDLSGTRFSGTALRHLSGMNKLRKLELPGEALRDDDLAHLEGLSKLEFLSIGISAPEITDAGLAHLSGLTRLQSLGFPGSGVTSAGIESIRTLTNLESITLDSSKVDDLTRFQYFPKLKSLSLSQTPVDDAGMAQASRLSGLAELYLDRTKVTNAGLPYLRPLKKLTRLVLWGTNTTSEDIAALGKVSLPDGPADSGENAP